MTLGIGEDGPARSRTGASRPDSRQPFPKGKDIK